MKPGTWGWESHQPLLYHFISKTSKPILEFGLGPYSTELIIEEKQPDQLFVTLEKVPEWYNKFKYLDSDTCKVELVKEYEYYDKDAYDWGLVFVDHRPAANRSVIINKYANSCDYMIVHDTQKNTKHDYVGMEEALQTFKYRFDLKIESITAHATVVSNVFELNMENFDPECFRKQTTEVEDVRQVMRQKREQRRRAGTNRK